MVQATIGPEDCAAALFGAGPLNDWDRAEMVRQQWEKSLVRAAYPSLEAFEVAVEQQLRQLRRQRAGEPARFDPESIAPAGTRRPTRILPRTDRALEPAVALAIDGVRSLLPQEAAARLDPRVPIEWTKRVVATTLGHWSIKLTGRNKGTQVIRVNRLLRTSPDIVSDDMLAYLIYHELLHHLLPGMGHDADFRKYESWWPNGSVLDAVFDTLDERWVTDPARYNRS